MNELQFLEQAFTPFVINRLKAEGQIRQDDAFGDIQSRSLEQISPYPFKRRIPNTNFDSICLTKYDLVLGKTSYTHLFQNETGSPIVTFGTAQDIPEVDVSFTSENIPVFSTKLGLSVTQDEVLAIKAGAFGEYGNDLLATKTEAVMKGLDEISCKLGFFGVPNRGISGLLTDANVTLDSSNFDYYAQTDAIALASEFLRNFYYVWNATDGREQIDTILIPLNLFSKFNTTYVANDGKNAMLLIRDGLAPFNVDLIPRREMKGSELRSAGVLPSNSTLDMMIFYKRKVDPIDMNASVERHATSFYSYPWAYTDQFKYRTVLRQSFTGVKFLYAGSAFRVTFPEP